MNSLTTTTTRMTTPMNNLAQQLHQIGLRALPVHVDDFLARATQARWSPHQLLEHMAQAEAEERSRRSLEQRLRVSGIKKFKPMADFDWTWPVKIERDIVERALTLEFLQEARNLILLGKNGVGKTMIAKNICHTAVLAGYSVLFRTAPELLEELQKQSPEGRRHKLSNYANVGLLCLDEVGYLSYADKAADLLYEVINRRYERKSVIITSNRAFKEWNQVFPNATCIATLLDRLLHHADVTVIEGDSYRMRESEKGCGRPAEEEVMSTLAPHAQSVLSLVQLVEQGSPPAPSLVEPGLLPAQGILFVGGEPKVGKSLLVPNLALSLAAGSQRLGFPISAPRRVLVCQFELPLPHFVSRLTIMRRALGTAADHRLLVDTRAAGHLLSAPQGLEHFLLAAKAAAAEVIVLDPLYSMHDQDENDTHAMAAFCQSLLRLRDASRAALVLVHHTRKSISRQEIGSAFRGSSALHAVGDSYLLLTRPSPQLPALELRFQFRYAASQPPRRLEFNPQTLWFSPAESAPTPRTVGRKVETTQVRQTLAQHEGQLRYNQLREEIMQGLQCSKRTAQLAITQAAQQGEIVQENGQYRLPLPEQEPNRSSPAGGGRPNQDACGCAG